MKATEPGTTDFRLVAATMREEIIDFYEARARRLDTPAGRRMLETNSNDAANRGDLLRSLLDSAGVPSVAGLHILDLGCGFGPLALYFAALGAQVTALDEDPEIIQVGARVAHAYDLAVTFSAGQMEEVALPARAFDVAVINNAFCYLTGAADRRRALGHSLRVLRPGGLVLIRDPNRLHPVDPFIGLPLIHRLHPRLGASVAGLFRRPRPLVRLASPRELLANLTRAGFVDVSVRGQTPASHPWWPPRYGRYLHAVARRPDRRLPPTLDHGA